MTRQWYDLPENMETLDALHDDDVLAICNYWTNLSSSVRREELTFWRTEWEYRRQRKVADSQLEAAASMKRMTWWLTGLTVVVAICTIVVMVFTILVWVAT